MAALVIPLVSAGNVPQLCADLVLHSLSNQFKFVKELDSKWMHPFIGPLDYVEGFGNKLYRDCAEKRFTTPLELFYNEKRKLYLLQQRTPVIQSCENEFCKKVLIPLIQELEVETVVILDSISPFEGTVPILGGATKCRFSIGTCSIGSIDDIANEFAERLQLDKESELSVNNTLFKFSGSSFQRGISTEQFVFRFIYHLLNSSVCELSLKEVKYLNMFIDEGDNKQDAHLLCEMLPQALETFEPIEKFFTPVSWKGLYGSRPIPEGYEEGIYT